MTTQLRQLLDSVAESQVPLGLGERALAGARRRRRRRQVVGAAVVTVVVTAGALAGGQLRVDDAPRPSDVADLPSRLPPSSGLPSLREAPMAAASVAYVVDGVLVVVSAADAHAAVVTAVDGGVFTSLPGPFRLAELSPDGRRVLLVTDWPPTVDSLGLPVYLVELADGAATELDVLLAHPGDQGWLQPRLMAWDPSGSAFDCVCVGGAADPAMPTVAHVVVDGVDGPTVSRLDVSPLQVGYGSEGGLFQLEPAGPWYVTDHNQRTPESLVDDPVVDQATLVAVSGTPARYLGASPGQVFAVRADGRPGWRVDVGEDPIVSLGAAVDGWLVVTRPADAGPGEPPPPAPLDVRWVGLAGASQPLTALPVGTTSASFASDLVPPSR